MQGVSGFVRVTGPRDNVDLAATALPNEMVARSSPYLARDSARYGAGFTTGRLLTLSPRI
jgi:hypothetical protein